MHNVFLLFCSSSCNPEDVLFSLFGLQVVVPLHTSPLALATALLASFLFLYTWWSLPSFSLLYTSFFFLKHLWTSSFHHQVSFSQGFLPLVSACLFCCSFQDVFHFYPLACHTILWVWFICLQLFYLVVELLHIVFQFPDLDFLWYMPWSQSLPPVACVDRLQPPMGIPCSSYPSALLPY